MTTTFKGKVFYHANINGKEVKLEEEFSDEESMKAFIEKNVDSGELPKMSLSPMVKKLLSPQGLLSERVNTRQSLEDMIDEKIDRKLTQLQKS